MLQSYSDRYWGGGGKYQTEYNVLYNTIVPESGIADSSHGELLRLMSNAYYRYYNDGDNTFYDMSHTVFDIMKFVLPEDLPKSVRRFLLQVQTACCPSYDSDDSDDDNGPEPDFDNDDLEKLMDDTIVYVLAKAKKQLESVAKKEERAKHAGAPDRRATPKEKARTNEGLPPDEGLPKTNRVVLTSGKIGQKLLKEAGLR